LNTAAAITDTSRSSHASSSPGVGALVEQRVAAGHEHAVHVGLPRDARQGLCLVHPRTHGANHPLVAQLSQRRERLSDRLVEVIVGIVDMRDVHAIEV